MESSRSCQNVRCAARPQGAAPLVGATLCRDRNLPRRRENRKPRRVAGRSRTQRTQRGAEIAEKSGIGPTSSSLRSPRPSAFSALTILAVSRRRLRIPPGDGRAARALLRAICALGRSDLVSRPQRPTPSRKSETAAGCWQEPNTENAKRRRDRREERNWSNQLLSAALCVLRVADSGGQLPKIADPGG